MPINNSDEPGFRLAIDQGASRRGLRACLRRRLPAARATLRRINGVLAGFAAAAILLAAFAISSGVLMRNLFGASTVWELEAGIYLMLYATFLGAAHTHACGGQIAINMLNRALSNRWRRYHRIALEAFAAALFFLILFSGVSDMWAAYTRGWHSDTIWGPPLWIPWLAVPLGAAALAATSIVEILHLALDETAGQYPDRKEAA